MKVVNRNNELSSGNGIDALYVDITRAIRSGKLAPGQKLQPITELAKKYNIAFGTARSAMARLEEQGLVKRMQGSGTFVKFDAENVQKTNFIYFFLPDVHDEFSEPLFNSTAITFQENGLCAIKALFQPNGKIDTLASVFDIWHTQAPAAVIVHFLNDQVDKAIQENCPLGTRVIAINRCHEYLPSGWYNLSLSCAGAARILADYVIRAGIKSLGLVLPELSEGLLVKDVLESTRVADADRRTTILLDNFEKVVSVRKALANVNSSCKLMLHYDMFGPDGTTDPFHKNNLLATEKWLSSNDRPDLIYGDNFRCAAIMKVADKIGLSVPEDIKIIGSINTKWSEVYDMTTIDWPKEEISGLISKLVLDGSSISNPCTLSLDPYVLWRKTAPQL